MGINWFEWGDDAFSRAKSENKLIVLDISAVWCHWCHMMDNTTYSDPQIVSTLNETFIPVRIDTDKRPDVNARYNMGGWPTTAVLTPEGHLIGGATYLSPSEMLETLKNAQDLYKNDKERLEEQAIKPQKVELPKGKADANIVETYRSLLEELYDSQHGGFGRGAKFPQANVYGLLFVLAEEGKGWKDRLVLTLQRK